MAACSGASSNKEIERFSRFLTVGAVGTILDFSLLSLLKLAGLPTLAANSLSFSAGMVNNFTLNRFWTFADVTPSDWRKQWALFAVVSLIGLAVNNIILLALEGTMDSLPHLSGWGYLPAKAAATCLVVFWNYLANRTWTFRNR